VYEGGRPRGFWAFMGSEPLLAFCGDCEGGWAGGRWPLAGAALAGGDGCAGLWRELLRFEPTRFLKRAFMELMGGGREARVRSKVKAARQTTTRQTTRR